MVDDTGFPKQGEHSVGVERQYSGTLGKVGNCQVAVSLHHVGGQGHTILGWRLYLPERWATDPARRKAAGIDLTDLASRLQEAGVESFATAWKSLLARIEQTAAAAVAR